VKRWIVTAIALASFPAHATYSINAVDTATGEVGGAGASCVGSLSVRVIYGAVPGVGVVHAQALLGGPAKDEAVTRLAQGTAPDAIVAAITDPGFDGNAQRRQYGIVDLQARAAGFTGAQTGAFADDRQGSIGTFTYAVQGNILTSEGVLDNTAAAFEAGGCDLADRLMRALEAGARDGEGDSRCTSRGVAADSAFLEVDRPGDLVGQYLRLEVTDTGAQDPLAMLRAQYDAWRATHPCPVVSPDTETDGDPGIAPTGDAGGCCSGSRGEATLLLVLLAALALRRR
jgi:uncharacterized Ntn-hydrolase superfamily protein